MIAAVIAAVMLVASAAVTGYSKLTLLNHYHFEDYLASPRARRLYWSVRIAAVFLAASIAALGVLTGVWFFAVPLCCFAGFVLYVNARATRLRLNGAYREFYRERGVG